MIKQEHEPRHSAMRFTPWIALVIIIAVVGGIRYRLLDVPLERDEGEFAYMGQLMLQGVPPYAEAYNMKLPGIYAAYAVTEIIFGETTRAVHWGLLLINGATIVLIFVIANRLFGAYSGVVAAGTYGVMSLSPAVLGIAGHATHFVLFPVLAGIVLLLRGLESHRRNSLFLGGILFGLGILMKQPAVFFALFAIVIVLWKNRKEAKKNILASVSFLFAGIVLPCGITCLWLAAAGVFDRFWFWTVTYAGTYGSQIPLRGGFELLADKFNGIFQSNYLILVAAACGVIISFHKNNRVNLPLLMLFFLFSFGSVCPGFHFREHYFIFLLPCVAFFAGLGVTALARFPLLSQKVRVVLTAVIFIAVSGQSIWSNRDIFFTLTPIEASRAMYGSNPFAESVEIADSVKAMTAPQDRVAVIGSEPQLYFYSGRRAATGYIYTYSLMESQPYALAMQNEMAREIERAQPAVIVYVNHHTSWLTNPASERFLLQWAMEYVRTNYALIGIVDMISPRAVRRRWGKEVQGYAVQSKNHVLIFRRKS